MLINGHHTIEHATIPVVVFGSCHAAAVYQQRLCLNSSFDRIQRIHDEFRYGSTNAAGVGGTRDTTVAAIARRRTAMRQPIVNGKIQTHVGYNLNQSGKGTRIKTEDTFLLVQCHGKRAKGQAWWWCRACCCWWWWRRRRGGRGEYCR